MGKSTISMAIFNSYVKLPEGIISMFFGANKSNFTIVFVGDINGDISIIESIS